MSSPLVEVDAVGKTYTSVRAVDGLSFTVSRGEIFAFLGPNGAGKTTTIRMLIGLIPPDRGTVRYGLREGHTGPVQEQIGYLPEERGLYPKMPILRTLVFLAGLRGMPPADAARAASSWLKRLGLGDRQHQKLNTLSKGNQQKVQFISAILHNPKFVILDEPFTGLDPLNQELFIELIEELRDSGMTILLSGHQMALIERLADRVLILHRGRELLSGTMRDIRRKVGAQQKLACRFETEPPLDELATLGSWERSADGEIEWTLRDVGLSPALQHLATRMAPLSIRTEEPSLHSIYLQAIRGAEEHAQSI